MRALRLVRNKRRTSGRARLRGGCGFEACASGDGLAGGRGGANLGGGSWGGRTDAVERDGDGRGAGRRGAGGRGAGGGARSADDRPAPQAREAEAGLRGGAADGLAVQAE